MRLRAVNFMSVFLSVPFGKPLPLFTLSLQTHNTLMYYAARFGHTRMVGPMKEHGANVDAPNHERMTALMVAALHGHDDTVRSGRLFLLSKCSCRDGWSLCACRADEPAAVMLAVLWPSKSPIRFRCHHISRQGPIWSSHRL